MKFVRYYDEKEIFSKKKRLKEKSISIKESLSRSRMKKLEEAREKNSFKNVLIIAGRVMFKNINNKPSVYYG